jgi:arylsulfatase A-like enzyme
MKQFFLFLLLGFRISLYSQTKPNIIVFLVDDMGWQDCSVNFWNQSTSLNKIYHTPNMERLAKEGMKFTNAYSAPVCTPSRSSMLTGVNSTHLGITNWTSPWKNNNTDSKDDQLSPADWNVNGLSPIPGIEKTYYAIPFPILLKEAGYYTIHVGKAHWALLVPIHIIWVLW